MDLPFFALGFGSDLLDCHLGVVCGFLQAFVDENVGGVFDGIVSEHLSHFLPAQFIPKAIRSKHYRFVFGVKLKHFDLRYGSDVVT